MRQIRRLLFFFLIITNVKISFAQQKIEYWDVVSDYLNKKGWITNAQARKITGITDTLKM